MKVDPSAVDSFNHAVQAALSQCPGVDAHVPLGCACYSLRLMAEIQDHWRSRGFRADFRQEDGECVLVLQVPR